ncbi:Recombination endonuclease VII [Blastococcus aurantiacus]|uniref:Recombination endonuclease VII n=1 Tax=Blastococcus aurantiacus TaxID=1550231 RepID=A0A1G7RCI9_9ACTN|nr:endonuclease VII domain-containing protein [Blastococcus aurantiacus]SDG08443.1 Recombination endonuclease VII [Blastococcus aurantiacus]
MKKCPACGQTKAAAEFSRNRTLKDGLSFYCLACNRERNKAWYRDNRRSLGKEVRDHSWIPDGFRWCPSCRQPVAHEDYTRNATSASGFGSTCRGCANVANSESYFYRRYKLTKQQVAEMRAAQGDKCAICGAPEPQHLDHDHATGATRALLCQRCNHGLGLFRDSPDFLHAAAFYVALHTARHQVAAEMEALGAGAGAASRPGEPPVGSQRRPGARGTSSRSTGRTSGARRREQAGEADA